MSCFAVTRLTSKTTMATDEDIEETDINPNDVDKMDICDVIEFFEKRNIDMPDLDNIEEMKDKIRSLIRLRKPSAKDTTTVSTNNTILYSTFESYINFLIRVINGSIFEIFIFIYAANIQNIVSCDILK